jgi:hypothetical protein
MTAHRQGDRATPRMPRRSGGGNREPTVRALQYRQIESRKSIVYLTVYSGIS